jgi:hypothetical protein
MTAPTSSIYSVLRTHAENSLTAEGSPLFATAPVFRDAESDFGGGSFHVSGLLAEDRIFIRNAGTAAGQISMQGNEVSFGGTVFGTVYGGTGTPFMVRFNPVAGTEAVNALAQNLLYTNTSDAPATIRTLHVNLVDASGADLGLRSASQPVFNEYSRAANPLENVTMDNDGAVLMSTNFVDLDGDGDKDLVNTYATGHFVVWRNGAEGSPGKFTRVEDTDSPFFGRSFPVNAAAAFADVDGDGDDDMIVTGDTTRGNIGATAVRARRGPSTCSPFQGTPLPR